MLCTGKTIPGDNIIVRCEKYYRYSRKNVSMRRINLQYDIFGNKSHLKYIYITGNLESGRKIVIQICSLQWEAASSEGLS